MTNEQMYRQKLLAWYDATKKHHPKDYHHGLELDELAHYIDTCRPSDDEGDAGNVLLEKLTWDKPNPATVRESWPTVLTQAHGAKPRQSFPLLADDLEDDGVSER